MTILRVVRRFISAVVQMLVLVSFGLITLIVWERVGISYEYPAFVNILVLLWSGFATLSVLLLGMGLVADVGDFLHWLGRIGRSIALMILLCAALMAVWVLSYSVTVVVSFTVAAMAVLFYLTRNFLREIEVRDGPLFPW